MDKKKKYLRFSQMQRFWIGFLCRLEKDVKEILKDGFVDLSQFPFGELPYRFYSVEEDLYCRRAFLDANGLICVSAGKTEDGEWNYTLGWTDMCQDITTLIDFMDCIYDNKEFQYDASEENALEGPQATIACAAEIIEEVCEMCCDAEEHQDVVCFLSMAAKTTRRWKEVKRLAGGGVDWDEAIESVFGGKENGQTEAETSVSAKLAGCMDVLNGIRHSGYVPYASPAPSSTESAIKRAIDGAAERLEQALTLHQSMPYGRK